MIRNVFSHPLEWAEKSVGTRMRFLALCACTLAHCIIILVLVHMTVNICLGKLGSILGQNVIWMWVLLYCVVFTGTTYFPILYLIALRRVTRKIAQK